MLLGLAFIVGEAFIPSFGMLGIGGGVVFVIGSIMLLKTNGIGFGIPVYLIITIAIITLGFFLLVLNLAFRFRRRLIITGLGGVNRETQRGK
ncbi:hypothetical protein [Coxiella-like endosymbiont]|uniref:hypothetical protein n=1 Tax=Coxiella-like endosymbiont TaxID=1592897 RepID=UPI00272A5236|nr:hypothetical protein [Coxiella-like endosymbiont]